MAKKPKEEYPEWQSWGVDPSKAEHQWNQGICDQCHHNAWAEDGYKKYLVGFSNDAKYRSERKVGNSPIEKIGAQVYQCPQCGKLGWYHMWKDSQVLFEYDRERGMRFCWPGAEDAYLAMVAARDAKSE